MATLLQKSQEILNEKETNILPGNLKSGVTAFGVEGTVVEVNNETKNITENGTYTPTSGKTGFSSVTVNVDSIPDGIFIQETQPTKTTDEALWLKEEDVGSETPSLDRVPTDFIIVPPSTTFSTFISNLTAQQITDINAKNYLLLCPRTGTGTVIFAFDSYFFNGDEFWIRNYIRSTC